MAEQDVRPDWPGMPDPIPGGPSGGGWPGGRYRLGDSLGAGGMAEVFRAEDTRLSRAVAIKILRAELSLDRSFRLRFESEARAAATLSHPNVVSIFDVDEREDGRPFIVMELVEGGSLADRLRSGPLDPSQAASLLAGTLAGLGAAHHAGILHRDIKPGNILLARDGSARVADFGIAKALAEAAGASDLTGTSLVLGTPRYLAPERALGQAATVQSDLWAVGAVLYEALAGQSAYAGDTPFELMAAASSERIVPPVQPLPPEGAALLAVAVRALSADPSERFDSAAAMADALAAARSSTVPIPTRVDLAPTLQAPVPLPPVLPPPVLPPPVRPAPGPAGWTAYRHRRPLVLALVAAVALALLIGLVVALTMSSGPAPVTTSHKSATTTASTSSTTTTTTTLSAPSALGALVRDAAAGEAAGTVDHGSAQNIANQAQQAVTDQAAGKPDQAANDLQQVAMVIANGVQSGAISSSESDVLQADLNALAAALGLGAAGAPPATAAPGPGAPKGHGHGPHG